MFSTLVGVGELPAEADGRVVGDAPVADVLEHTIANQTDDGHEPEAIIA